MLSASRRERGLFQSYSFDPAGGNLLEQIPALVNCQPNARGAAVKNQNCTVGVILRFRGLARPQSFLETDTPLRSFQPIQSRSAGFRSRHSLGDGGFPRSPDPGGMSDNSPTFQRWVGWPHCVLSPGGTADIAGCKHRLWGNASGFSRPFGTWATWNSAPNVETLGYCRIIPPGLRSGRILQNLCARRGLG